jgi:hypothetical protein
MAQSDPTQKNRDAIKDFFRAIIPENSPAANSGDSAVTPEARARMEAQSSIQTPAETIAPEPELGDADFVNPSQVSTAERQPSNLQSDFSSQGINTYKSGLDKEANALDALGDQEAQAIGQAEVATKDYASKIQTVQEKEDAAFQQFQKEDDEIKRKMDNFEIKPTDIFAGKATWQKIIGGIGLFLGSITPEGAKNVQNFINQEIERDIDIQKQQYALLKNRREDVGNQYKRKLDKYGSEKMAMLSMKQEALSAVELQLKKLQANAKGDLARAKLDQGLGTVQIEQEKINSLRVIEMMKLQEKTSKGAIPGYEGSISNPTLAKDLTDRVSAKNSALNQIAKLESLMKEGARNPLGSNSDLANQTRDALAADMAKAMFGRSSDAELDMARKLIPDITEIFRKDSTSKKLFEQLKGKLNYDVDAAAASAGLRKSIPVGARKA